VISWVIKVQKIKKSVRKNKKRIRERRPDRLPLKKPESKIPAFSGWDFFLLE
jgi:hypothetical protein